MDPGNGLIVFLIGAKVENNVINHSAQKLTGTHYLIEFSLNVFTEFSELSDKNKIILKDCRARTHYLLCERQGLYHCATDTADRGDS